MNPQKPNRREFLGKATLGIAATTVGVPLLEQAVSAPLPAAGAGEMPYRTLGRSGEKVSLVGLGGYHIGAQKDEAESIRIIRTAVDKGINFLDNCWDYNHGESEVRMGKALRDGYRKRVFLMTKVDGQVKDVAARQIDESLRRLQTDAIDLLQFHEVIRPADPDRIFGPNGSFEAALEAKKAGKLRYIGFTGHKDPDIHLKMLDAAFKARVYLRCRTDAFERYGCPLQELYQEGSPRSDQAWNWGAGDEANGLRGYSAKQYRDAGRVPALRHEFAHLGSNHGLRQPENPRSGAGSSTNLQASRGKTGRRNFGEDCAGCGTGRVRAV